MLGMLCYLVAKIGVKKVTVNKHNTFLVNHVCKCTSQSLTLEADSVILEQIISISRSSYSQLSGLRTVGLQSNWPLTSMCQGTQQQQQLETASEWMCSQKAVLHYLGSQSDIGRPDTVQIQCFEHHGLPRMEPEHIYSLYWRQNQGTGLAERNSKNLHQMWSHHLKQSALKYMFDDIHLSKWRQSFTLN